MIEILLTQGKVALIDDADYLVSQFKWYAAKNRNVWYARNNKIQKYMHQLIMGDGYDHINGNGLDNRRSNLRSATVSQNACNAPPQKNSTSKFKGVDWDGIRQWRARIRISSKDIWLGRYDLEQEAALAYDKAALTYHGDFAWLNRDHFEELQ
jgi:phage-related protein